MIPETASKVATSLRVDVADTSVASSVSVTIENDITEINEGQSVTFLVNAISAPSPLYWTVIPKSGSSIDGDDFSQLAGELDLSGEVEIVNDVGTLTLTATNDLAIEGVESFALGISFTEGGAIEAESPTITINDTSTGYRITTITERELNEGQSTTLTVQVDVTPKIQEIFYEIVPVVGDVSAGDFVGGSLTGSILTDETGSGEIELTLNADNLTEGFESFRVVLKNLVDDTLATSAVIDVNDTSRELLFTLPTGSWTVKRPASTAALPQSDPSYWEGGSNPPTSSLTVNRFNLEETPAFSLAALFINIQNDNEVFATPRNSSNWVSVGETYETYVIQVEFNDSTGRSIIYELTIDYTTQLITFALISDSGAVTIDIDVPASITEGQTVSITVTNPVLLEETYYWRLETTGGTPYTTDDFNAVTGNVDLTGTTIPPGGSGSFNITAKTDPDSGSETFVVALYDNETYHGSPVAVSDSVDIIDAVVDWSISVSPSSVNEGDILTFNIQAPTGTPDGTQVAIDLDGLAARPIEGFSFLLPSFRYIRFAQIENGAASFTAEVYEDYTTTGNQNVFFSLYNFPSGQYNLVAQSNQVTINDTSTEDGALQIEVSITSSTRTLTLPISGSVSEIVWQRNSVSAPVVNTNKTYTFDRDGTFTILVFGASGTFGNGNSAWTQQARKILDWGDSTFSALNNIGRNITTVPTNLPSSVTSLERCFYAHSVTIPSAITTWDVSNVTDMAYMFYQNNSSTNLSSWDVSSVTDMSFMFYNSSNFTGFGSWNTSSVTNMESMFEQGSSVNSSIVNWDVSSVTNMINMFRFRNSFDQDLSGWCVSLIPSQPSGFDTGTSTSWTTAEKPVWGTCP